MHRIILLAAPAMLALCAVLTAFDDLYISPDHPAIQYSTRPAHDPVAELNRKIQEGRARLKFDPANGYLRPLLDALGIPVESQMAVFSKTGFQANGIGPHNPRAVFFNDSVAVAWVRGAWTVELAAQDPEQGVIFYTLDQMFSDKPVFQRRNDCLTCHNSYNAAGVPGMLVRSVFTARDGRALYQLGNYYNDDSSPIEQRWGGWYVTGKSGGARHMGNILVDGSSADAPAPEARELASLEGKIDTGGYLSQYSDIVALMVFEHQMRAMNLITRLGWESRYAAYEKRPMAPGAAIALADYLLFVEEAPLHGRIEGSSGFAEKFAAIGPADSKGRSLRQFDLERRLMWYRCSYMIYSAAFDALPAEARRAVYQRMREILSTRMTPADRQAVSEILRQTKPGW